MNAKEEFIKITKDKRVKCATIEFDDEQILLSVSDAYNQAKYKDFLNKLDFNYDAGYGRQLLGGLIWFTDGTWARRYEYDGAEWWEIMSLPKIPAVLL